MLFVQYVNEYGVHVLKPAADINEIRLNTSKGDEVIFNDETYAYMPDVMEAFVEIVGGEDEA